MCDWCVGHVLRSHFTSTSYPKYRAKEGRKTGRRKKKSSLMLDADGMLRPDATFPGSYNIDFLADVPFKTLTDVLATSENEICLISFSASHLSPRRFRKRRRPNILRAFAGKDSRDEWLYPVPWGVVRIFYSIQSDDPLPINVSTHQFPLSY